MSAKICATCGAENKGTHASYCPICYSAYKRAWYLKNREKEIARCTEYNKKNPHVPRNSMRRSRANNPDSHRQSIANWRLAHPEEYRRIEKNKWHMRQAAKGGNVIAKADWLKVIENHHHKCAYCGSCEKLTMDHVIPLSKGGTHTIDNVLPACKRCNNMKFNTSAEEFRLRLEQENVRNQSSP